jgi:uncharacterized protein
MTDAITFLGRYVFVTAAAVSIAALVAPASAQSFRCGAAETKSELAICPNDRLSNLDDRMSGLYETALAAVDSAADQKRLRNYQAQFLSARDACGRNVSCITGAYLDQIEVLQARIRVSQAEGD